MERFVVAVVVHEAHVASLHRFDDTRDRGLVRVVGLSASDVMRLVRLLSAIIVAMVNFILRSARPEQFAATKIFGFKVASHE